MSKDLHSHLRMDKRLMRRPGWIAPQELESRLAELPDVAEKATTAAEEEDRASAEASEPRGE